MVRPLRLTYPGAVYHVTARGNARQAIYRDGADRQAFLSVLADVVMRYHWRCYAYCLMNNHYHLLIETPQGNLSIGMRQLNGVYEVCRYVVLNPVRARVVTRPQAYRWSSYRATAGVEKAPEWLTREWILGQFHSQRRRAEQKYQHFVRDGISTASPWAQVQGQVVLGRTEFVETLKPLLADKDRMQEIPRAQRLVDRPALREILSAQQVTTKDKRDQAIWAAHVQSGYSLTAIGQHLGLHYTTISKIIQRQQNRQTKKK